MSTIDRIAEVSGVSRTTVAHILRNRPGYSAKTRQKVLEVAKRLNYRPNYLGKALAGGRSMTLGLLVSSIDRPNEIETVRAIESSARAKGWLTFLSGWEEDLDPSLCTVVEGLLSRRVDGIVMYRTRPLPGNVRKLLDGCGVPVVYLGWTPDDALHVVRDEREQAIEALGEHLASLGHTRAAYFHSFFDGIYPGRRLDLYRAAFERRGIVLDVSDRWYIPKGEDYELASYQLMRSMPWGDGAPTVLLAHEDTSARGIMTALRERGMEVPQDVAVVGWGDLPAARAGRPALTTIRQPSTIIGHAVFKLLHQLIEAPEQRSARHEVVMRCELVIRESTRMSGHLGLVPDPQSARRL